MYDIFIRNLTWSKWVSSPLCKDLDRGLSYQVGVRKKNKIRTRKKYRNTFQRVRIERLSFGNLKYSNILLHSNIDKVHKSLFCLDWYLGQ